MPAQAATRCPFCSIGTGRLVATVDAQTIHRECRECGRAWQATIGTPYYVEIPRKASLNERTDSWPS